VVVLVLVREHGERLEQHRLDVRAQLLRLRDFDVDVEEALAGNLQPEAIRRVAAEDDEQSYRAHLRLRQAVLDLLAQRPRRLLRQRL